MSRIEMITQYIQVWFVFSRLPFS